VDALDDSGSAKHAGYEDKEARRQRRQKRLERAGRQSGMGQTRVAANEQYVFIPFLFAWLLIFTVWIELEVP